MGGELEAQGNRAAAPAQQGYFTAAKLALFLFLTVLLVFLPLVLPPPPPPPPVLLVVPVGFMAAVLLALALVPSDARLALARGAVASSCLS